MMNWYKWDTKEEFDYWHERVINGLSLPKVGLNQATGKEEPNKQKTISYTMPIEVAVDDWRAPVSGEVASLYSDNLGTLCEPPPPANDES